MRFREPPSEIVGLDWNMIAHGLLNHGTVVAGTEHRTIPEYRVELPVPCQVQFAPVGSAVRLYGKSWRVKLIQAKFVAFAGNEKAAYTDWFALRLAF